MQAFYRGLTALAPDGPERAGGGTAGRNFCFTGYLAALGAMENGQRRREDARRFASPAGRRGRHLGPSSSIDAATLGLHWPETAPGERGPVASPS